MVVGAFVHKYKTQLCVGVILAALFVGAMTNRPPKKPFIISPSATPTPTIVSPVVITVTRIVTATPTATPEAQLKVRITEGVQKPSVTTVH